MNITSVITYRQTQFLPILSGELIFAAKQTTAKWKQPCRIPGIAYMLGKCPMQWTYFWYGVHYSAQHLNVRLYLSFQVRVSPSTGLTRDCHMCRGPEMGTIQQG
ncbi:hypothetical protein Y032_0005g2415 [Ancylostoma ceylanicum]|uniref:Uncharacterized protein n=1 Tax=Ancylostoma ceylanicum TaxID=53326 RepID=A0A016VRP8_9BILA|nr:hypothetical protein Y032_0005g2415 [Ancylostoma ceylanicum]